MLPKLKSPVSDSVFGAFILECVALSAACEKLVKDIDDMLQIRCAECSEPLSDGEIQEARQNGLRMDDLCCERCWGAWLSQKIDETRHPDDPSGMIVN